MIVRLNKYISMCGVASRRKADELIETGGVKVNGRVVKELGRTIDTETDRIEVLGNVLEPELKRYVMLYKPKLYITALGEGQDKKRTIEELIKSIPERVFPVGRLDYDAEGLIILTNDGELANKILHPKYELPKVYRARVRGVLGTETYTKMKAGTDLEDGPAKPDSIKIIKKDGESTTVELSFHEGRNHLVKRFFAKFGHPVMQLTRMSVGPIKIGSLERGRWRDLTASELKTLNRALEKAG
ncbi:MAG TPA: pseudouridine synthase [Thermodesulfobacteriota bacterium]|nr:pseudouridine synthase [Thermodesulfobacteriota bacterium]